MPSSRSFTYQCHPAGFDWQVIIWRSRPGMEDEFMLGKDSAAQIVPGLHRKGDFLQITLLLLVNNTKDEWWATGIYCNLLLPQEPHVALRAGQIQRGLSSTCPLALCCVNSLYVYCSHIWRDHSCCCWVGDTLQAAVSSWWCHIFWYTSDL